MSNNSKLPWIIRFSAAERLATSFAVAVVAFAIQPGSISSQTRILISWDVGALFYLALAWWLVSRSDARLTRHRVLRQDQSGYLIFLLVLSAASASVVAIGFLVGNLKELTFWPRASHLVLSIVALISSWLLIQTVFAFHYARRYYSGRDLHADPAELLFPGGREPDYLDFAYYSFVVGMTSQVSDVAVASREMRRLTLMHGILSFIFNIAVVALSINIIASVI